METDLSLTNILNKFKDENEVANISQKKLSNRLDKPLKTYQKELIDCLNTELYSRLKVDNISC